MELSSQEDHDIPIPISSTYGGGHGHMIHHHHDSTPAAPPNNNNNNNDNNNIPSIPTNGNNNGLGQSYLHQEENHHPHVPPYNSKKHVAVRYKECLKNHAAAMGGNATDGCGEFMPSGEEGTIEALTCSACNCHRNFHRKEIEGEVLYQPPPPPPPLNRKLMLTHHPHQKIRSAVPHQMIMPASYNNYMSGGGGGGGGGSHPYMPNSESDDQMEEGFGGGGGVVVARPAQAYNHHHHHHGGMTKKRFRTKFTQEQKEKMLSFAERVGWKIQRQEESVVQQFCQEIGVKRRVLKVWMHNNKHNLAKKNSSSNNLNNNATTNTSTATGNLASSA